MAFKLNRPFGNVATFRRGDEFFDWMVWYEATTEYGVSGMVWQDDKPINTVAKVLEMGRQAFLLEYDEIYASPDTPESRGHIPALEAVANADAQDYIDQNHPPMVTYAHSSAPNGTRFRDFKGKEPTWAVDIQPCEDRS